MTFDTNKNAVIRKRTLKNGNFRVETARRDSGIAVSMTETKERRTKFSLRTEDGLVVRLDGRQARTVFRVLANYYQATNKSLEPVSLEDSDFFVPVRY